MARSGAPGEEDARTAATEHAKRVIYLVLTVVEVAVALRFALRLLAANPDAEFSRALYALTTPLVLPFQGVFPDAQRRGSVVELSTLLALAIYAIVAWMVVRVLLLVRER